MAGELERRLTTATLTTYGVGVIIGAGIYVLVGKIASIAGNGLWLAFVGAALAALPTGLSYAELASRYPRSAGEAVFVDRAFGRDGLSFLVGFLILASGVASTAAVAHGFTSYLGDLLSLGPHLRPLVIAGFLVVLSLLNHRGIRETTWLNTTLTIASVGGLLVLVLAGLGRWGTVDVWTIAPPEGPAPGTAAVLVAGMALAFYAFIGFEDICNVAEEVRRPHRTIPRAIILSVVIASAVYVLLGITVVNAVPAAELTRSEVPLMLVVERLLPSWGSWWLSVIALFAVTNTALFNLIMCSRMLYGMGRSGWIPRRFGVVHERRKTPTLGVLTGLGLALAFAMTGALHVLAEATNAVILLAFMAVDLSLLVVKRRRVPPDDPTLPFFSVPWVVPLLGLLSTGYLVTRFSPGAYLRAGGLLAVGGILFAIQRVARRRREEPEPRE
ncbi:MAG: amino acid permease [Myxococcales bacterium]|nr:amino acid permease [Myxococcales bacterium]